MRSYLVICTRNKTSVPAFKVGKVYAVNRKGIKSDDGGVFTSFLKSDFGNNPRDKWINWTDNTSVNFTSLEQPVRRF